MGEITQDQVGCARCRSDGHEQITYRPLTFPVKHDGEVLYTHWATCPTNGQPIMMMIVPKPKTPPPLGEPASQPWSAHSPFGF